MAKTIRRHKKVKHTTEEKLEYKISSKKYSVPKGCTRHIRNVDRVLVTNSGPTTTCPGKLSGDCQLPPGTTCYGHIPERQYPKCIPYRIRQEKQWNSKNSSWYSDQIRGLQSRAQKPITHHRMNEVHDWRHVNDVLKTCNIAKNNKKIGIETFTYTSRRALWEECRTAITANSPLVVNGSGFMAHNEYRVVSPGYVAQKNEYWCPDKCYQCKMCKKRLGITILALPRHTKKS